MEPDENDLKETAELDRLVEEAANRISEHCETIHIFATKQLENGKRETYRHVYGVGNYYARYGVVREWVNEQEGFHRGRFKDEGDDLT